MIISRTPFRISFFGGGTDYPAWYREHGGSVVATTIDKYCYLSCRFYPPFFEHKFRLVYIRSENCRSIDEISHPAVREILRYLKWDRGLEIHHVGDLPARGGMGSSSSFTVGLLHALYAMQGKMLSKRQLAMESIHIEQEILRETVGSQDQVSTAYGGLNHIIFQRDGEVLVKPVTLSQERLRQLESHLMLFYTGIRRTASNIAQSYVNNIGEKQRQMHAMMEMVDEGVAILNSNRDIKEFGKLLHEAWKVKCSFSDRVSNSSVDEIYAKAIAAGAIGGKITGAGGGGFMLLFVPPEQRGQVREALKSLVHVPFRFEGHGSQIIFYDPEEDFSRVERERATLPIKEFRELEPYQS
jgi:D-glycero-alpha-D-manno-heptose-7-phosphate kinase